MRLTTPCAVSVDFIQNTPFSFNYWGGVIGAFPSSVCPRAPCGFAPYGCFPCGLFSSPFRSLFRGTGGEGFSYLSISLQLAVLPFAVSMLRMRTF